MGNQNTERARLEIDVPVKKHSALSTPLAQNPHQNVAPEYHRLSLILYTCQIVFSNISVLPRTDLESPDEGMREGLSRQLPAL